MYSRLRLPIIGLLVLPLLGGFLVFQLWRPASAYAGEEGQNTGGGSRANSASAGIIHRPTPLKRSSPPKDEDASEAPAQTGFLHETSQPLLLRTLHVVLGSLRILWKA